MHRISKISKLTVSEVLPLVRALYARNGGGVGCCLHIVLADGNVRDDHIRFCIEQAKISGHQDCLDLANKLMAMSKTQRIKLARHRQ